jgi:lipopolysaccharide transport system ATP-binding protein
MNDAIITVENLSKKYRIKHDDKTGVPRYSALRDVIASKFTGLFQNRKSKIKSRKSVEDFWALKNVSFEVLRGEVVGIIGRNGAGKTTLLKILTRITEPTEGRVHIKGRVASLLEVGTGFHPELTGRENIFLNGAILGMTRAEIKAKFDEIVAFAETEEFLDTPVKRYSSGMYVRLAFAVAAHLEPDILLVDEVLAVGDMEFQKKCLGKMQDVSTKEGRTVLFVSHNLAAILNLCSKGLLLNAGKTVMFGDIAEVCDSYTKMSQDSGATERTTGIFRSLSLVNESGVALNTLGEGEPLRFRCSVRAPVERCLLSLIIKDRHNSPLCELFANSFFLPRQDGSNITVLVEPEQLPLRPGHYSVDCWCGDRFSRSVVDWFHRAVEFEVVGSEKSERGTKLLGPFWFPSRWRVEQDQHETARETR